MSGGKNSIMLFGVQLTEGTNNTTSKNSQYQQPPHQVFTDATYVADNVIHASAGTSGSKGVLERLRQKCKGKWKIICESVSVAGNDVAGTNMQHNQLGEMNRRGSLTLSGDLSKKTVDEVWRARDRQQTLGEMTLEDSRQNITLQEKHMMPGFVAVHAIQQPFHFAEQVVDAAISPSSSMETPGRKRVASGIVIEKTEERRQKRMTQNREAAARSRARKQAYTQELELKVSRLEEDNEILRKQNAYTQELERKVSRLEEDNKRLRKHNEVKSSTIMEDEQIQQETVVPQPPPTPTAYPSTHNDGIPDNPLPMVLDRIALPVLPLSWVDLNGNGFSFSSETFPLSLKLQSLPLWNDHSLKSSSHSSPSASSSGFNFVSRGKSSGVSGEC